MQSAAGVGERAALATNVRSLAGVSQPRAQDASAAAPTASFAELIFDESIDIELGFDRASGHLAIVRGEVRVEPRALTPAPPHPLPSGVQRPGSLINVIA